MHRIFRKPETLLCCWLFILATAWAEPEFTLIEASPINDDMSFVHYRDQADGKETSDATMLYHIPGLSLTESQGPLGHSEISYRGLRNNRLSIELEGLSLNNPMTGFNDANAMFLFAAKRLSGHAQSLSISLPEVSKHFAKGIFGFGSEQSIKMGLSTGAPIGDKSSFFSALQISSTDGRFSFAQPLATNASKDLLYRENNDQERLQALVQLRRRSSTGEAHVIAALNQHQGGIPGFAFAPTPNLRSNTLYAGLATGFSAKIKKSELSISFANSLFDYRSHDQGNASEELSASTHELSIGLNSLSLPEWFDLTLSEKFVVEHAYGINKTRVGGGFVIQRNMRFQGAMKPRLNSSFCMMGYSGHGLLFKKELGFSFDPIESLSLSAGFSRSQRLPTFMEMYANNRFFKGNADLQKESVMDFELGSKVSFADDLHFHAAAFYGFLSDVIVYVPFLNDKLQPTNIGRGRRFGIDLALFYEPKPWLLFESKNSLLKTKNKDTDSPLPHAPTLAGLTRLRLGPPDSWSLNLQSRYKGPSFSNIYGGLRTDGYIIFDTLLNMSLSKHLAISLSINNILNQKNARDSYQMPMPGTVYFAQFELGGI